MIKPIFLILLFIFSFSFSFSSPSHASDGYPDKRLKIMSEDVTKVKNDFCFSVVVSMNNHTYDMASNTEISFSFKTWSNWNWLPGKRSKVIEKTVKQPLAYFMLPTYGPGNPPTHVGADKYGYDFSILEGTTVFAMEGGVVIRIIEKYNESHRDEKRKGESNVIEVMHEDGTVARYSHLQKKSSKVKLCDKIKTGDPIALSGNTGFSSGPHLHVDILRPLDGKFFETIPLKFIE